MKLCGKRGFVSKWADAPVCLLAPVFPEADRTPLQVPKSLYPIACEVSHRDHRSRCSIILSGEQQLHFIWYLFVRECFSPTFEKF